MARGRGGAGTARTSGLRRPLVREPLDHSVWRWPRPETIVRCRSPGSRRPRSGGRGPRWAGRLRLGPGDPRRDSHLPRAPAGLASPSHGEWFGWELCKGARPFPLWWRRLGPPGRGRCKSFHLRLGILLVLSHRPPPPQPPLTPCRDETRRAGGGWGWDRDAPLAVSAAADELRKVLPPRPGKGRREGERGRDTGLGGRRRTFSFAASERARRALWSRADQ